MKNPNATSTTTPTSSTLFTSAGTWRFPHSTCEAMDYDGPVLQPYSAATNAMVVAFLIAMMIFPKRCAGWTISKSSDLAKKSIPGQMDVSTLARLALLPLALFEAFHAFSHIIHWEKGSTSAGSHNAQEVIIHILGYGMGASVFACCYNQFGLTKLQIWIAVASLLDLINWFAYGGSFIALFGLCTLIAIVVTYYPLLGPFLQNRVMHLSVNTLLLSLQIVHESICCQLWVTKINPHIPYHMIIEAYGLYLFLYLADTLYLVDTVETGKQLITGSMFKVKAN